MYLTGSPSGRGKAGSLDLGSCSSSVGFLVRRYLGIGFATGYEDDISWGAPESDVQPNVELTDDVCKANQGSNRIVVRSAECELAVGRLAA